MTYYEELGIPASAPEEDIHRAHRALTKLLHPDQYSDDQLRHLADLQFRRINVMVDCLLDPVERRVYDESLLADRPTATPAPSATDGSISGSFVKRVLGLWHARTRNWQLLSWPTLSLALLASFGIAAMLFKPAADIPAGIQTVNGSGLRNPGAGGGHATGCDEGEASPVPGTRVAGEHRGPAVQALIRRTSATPEAAVAGSRHLDAAEPRRGKDSGRGIPENAVLREESRGLEVAVKAGAGADNSPHGGAAAHETPASSAAAAPNSGASSSSGPASSSDSDSVAGVWIYSPPAVSGPGDRKLYRPEYIELRMRADSGVLVGQYKGRYVIPDRPISPTVTFQFAGKLNGKAGSFPWKSPDGSTGKVDLKVLTARSLQVDWKTIDVRDSLGLISGTAVLVKRGD